VGRFNRRQTVNKIDRNFRKIRSTKFKLQFKLSQRQVKISLTSYVVHAVKMVP
jgi:hypothetical protein